MKTFRVARVAPVKQAGVKIVILVLVCVLALSFALPSVAQTIPTWPPPGCTFDPVSLAPQQILVCLPPAPVTWNGALVVYAHGYVAPQLPLGLPSELTSSDGQTLIGGLLGNGFAFAATSYSRNGYAVEQAEADLNALVAYFAAQAPMPPKVFLVGASEGGLIAVQQIEKHPDIYYGGLAMCGPVGGMPYQVQYMGDFRVVFDYFFPGVFARFGVADAPADAYQYWQGTYFPAIAQAISTRPLETLQLFSVSGAAVDPLDPAKSSVTTAQSILRYSIFSTPDLMGTASGNPYDNQPPYGYWGSFDDSTLNLGVERVAATAQGADYLRQHYQTKGLLTRPLVTLHSICDPVVPFRHELLYGYLARSLGKGRLLTILPVVRYGHCNFTPGEILAAFGLLVWQATGQRQAGLEAQAVLPSPVNVDEIDWSEFERPEQGEFTYLPLVIG